jgi:hypothetical protein
MRRTIDGLAAIPVALALTFSFGSAAATEDASPAVTVADGPVATVSAAEEASPPPVNDPLFVEAVCTAIDELFVAVGNPDTGEISALGQALEDAIVAADAKLVETTTAVMLAHLEASRSAAAQAAGYPPAANAMSAFDDFLAIVADGVVAEHDAAPDGLDAARAAAQRTWDQAAVPWRAWITDLRPVWHSVAGDTPIPCPSPPVTGPEP